MLFGTNIGGFFMSILKYAYLLDQDNYIVENKVFIDLMWHIAKNKDNGDGKPKGINTKSYVIRNAGIMFQQIFYWHFHYLKKGKPTKYRYNKNGEFINVVKMDFEDWWNSLRLTDTEITTANKFLVATGLIDIYKMRIKVKEKEIFKPSNCYSINTEQLETYMDSIIEISEDMYKEKVDKVREKNIETSRKHKEKKSTDLSTDESVTIETQVTLDLDELMGSEEEQSTLSTEKISDDVPVTLETGVTKATLETQVTKATLETGVANKSNTSFTDSSCANKSYKTSCDNFLVLWEKTKTLLRKDMSEVSFNTWIEESIISLKQQSNEIIFEVVSEFNKNILQSRYADNIRDAISIVTDNVYNLRFTCIE